MGCSVWWNTYVFSRGFKKWNERNESFLIVLFYLVVSRGFYLWIYKQLVGLLGRVIGPTQGLYLHRTTQHRETQTHIHAPSRIRTCDLNIGATEGSTCLRPLGYWDRLWILTHGRNGMGGGGVSGIRLGQWRALVNTIKEP
jgi:hypothetical protein